MLYMTDSEPVQVHTTAISGSTGKYRPDDNLSITLTFKDGSIGTIIYTAKGSKSFSRERFEVFCEDSVAVIEDFRRGQLIQGGRTRQIKKLSMDMGYVNEMRFFFRQAAAPAPAPGLFRSLAATTRATLGAVESLRSGKAVAI
jgi:predicted dehydrogenase